MDIAIFLPSSLRSYGGGEIGLIKISKGLDNSGFKNTIYENESFAGPFRVDDSFLNGIGAKYQRVKFRQLGKFGQLFFHPMPLKESLDEHSINMVMLWRLPSRGQMKEINSSDSKKIFLLHGIGLEKLRMSHPIILAYQIYMRLQLFMIKRLLVEGRNFFQVMNTFQQRMLVKAGIPPERIFLIETGVETESYNIGKNNSHFNVLFIGRIENLQKGIKRLIRVAKYVKRKNDNISFTVMGSGRYSSRLMDVTYLDYLEFVSEESKNSELSNSNLLLHSQYLVLVRVNAISGLKEH